MTRTTQPARNRDWGFFGTISRHADPEEAWALTARAISEATGCSGAAVGDSLDSRHGRHFADDVINGLHAGLALEQAVAATVDRWMGWQIGRRTSRETGIPHDLPYLTGFVAHFEILADAVADA